ncbi:MULTISPECIES: BON domain-containing protein [Burkholderiaceae]|uniref:BON domain-containing protein n=2 Tax=Burkholderiaceae TaxID=119060 RepID=UPI001423F882|nr:MULTISPECIES: BON domain-containing protein [Burkholderiaceae]NIF51735.1 BON domain-containing protein [Burkholderia sp. Ax-1724]NIF79286.1 BON domain-containing protein [Paraburkholderia sp. Cy-641]
MKTNGASRILGAMFAMAFATCVTYANAQTPGGTPGDMSAQNMPMQSRPGVAAPAPRRNRSDTQLVRDVRRAFTRTPGLNSASIHVESRHAFVTLTGSVPQRSQIERAGSAARSVQGVRAVSNRLTVRTRRGSGH